MTQKVIDLAPSGVVGFDDEIHINTQASSQWDSLKHVSQPAGPHLRHMITVCHIRF